MDGKIALVTGASRGIGQAILHELARRGAFVIGTATSESGATAIAAALAASDMKGEGLMLDVTDAAGVTASIDGLLARHGRIDILVNNAGITRSVHIRSRLS